MERVLNFAFVWKNDAYSKEGRPLNSNKKNKPMTSAFSYLT